MFHISLLTWKNLAENYFSHFLVHWTQCLKDRREERKFKKILKEYCVAVLSAFWFSLLRNFGPRKKVRGRGREARIEWAVQSGKLASIVNVGVNKKKSWKNHQNILKYLANPLQRNRCPMMCSSFIILIIIIIIDTWPKNQIDIHAG